jgi:hypothetical protein
VVNKSNSRYLRCCKLLNLEFSSECKSIFPQKNLGEIVKNFLTTILLSLSILSASLYEPKSEAIIGLVSKNKVVRTIVLFG